MTLWRLPRESVEWVGPVTLVGDTGVLELAVVPVNTRPTSTDWAAPTVLGGQQGYLVSGLAPGSYRLWARITDAPEVPVFDNVASIVIT